MSKKSLEIFHKLTERWFADALGSPTAVQEQAWPVIAAGSHTLVSAPTGTGKTLTAFLTGDTTQTERNRMIKTPPHILITTPESLYLMLTSKSGQKILRTAKAIIFDELHALIDSQPRAAGSDDGSNEPERNIKKYHVFRWRQYR